MPNSPRLEKNATCRPSGLSEGPMLYSPPRLAFWRITLVPTCVGSWRPAMSGRYAPLMASAQFFESWSLLTSSVRRMACSKPTRSDARNTSTTAWSP
jgi:hypothetical protein